MYILHYHINMWKYLILLAVVTSVNSSPNGIKYLNSLPQNELRNIRAEILEDALLNVTQLIEKYGYPVETHELETDDGYLITVHRIPGGRISKDAHNTPILLMHGLLSSSADWIINGPEKALGYILADEGYDVWMGNARGNYYSRKHISLDPDKDDQFWKFSWNEIGYYDLPKMITHILETTGRSKLHYIGHSQGGTVFFVMNSERPEFNEKILLMQGLAPAAYIAHARSPIVTYLAPYVNSIEKMFELIGYNEFLPSNDVMQFLANNFCTDESPLQPVCTNVLFLLCGYNPDQLNSTMLPVYMSHTPAGAASRQVIHFVQEHVSQKFRKFDHGTEKNLEIYGSETPPDYNLTKIVAPVAIYHSDNDLLVDAIDVEKLYAEISNPVGKFRVPMAEFNHLDYIWAIDAPSLLYDDVLRLLNMYNPDS